MILNPPQVYNSQILSIQLIENDILEIRFIEDQEIEIRDVVEIMNFAEKVANGKRLKHLYVIGKRTLPSLEARILSCSEFGSRFKIIEAIVFSGLSQRMIFNFMVNVEGTSVPCGLFNNRLDAISWLNSY